MPQEFDDYNRITGDKERVAMTTTDAIVKIMHVALSHMSVPGEKVCLLGGCSIPTLSGLGVLLGFDRSEAETVTPTVDDVTFGACYVIAATEGHPAGLIVGFSLEHIAEARRIFKSIKGYEYPVRYHIEKAIKEMMVASKDVPDHIRKFVAGDE